MKTATYATSRFMTSAFRPVTVTDLQIALNSTAVKYKVSCILDLVGEGYQAYLAVDGEPMVQELMQVEFELPGGRVVKGQGFEMEVDLQAGNHIFSVLGTRGVYGEGRILQVEAYE